MRRSTTPRRRWRPDALALGDTEFDWRPEGWWEPLYHLRPQELEAYEAFRARAAEAVAWRRIATFEPAGEPITRAALIDASVEWWSRRDGALWVLVERMWSGWPDPLMYSLCILPPGGDAFLMMGEFDTLPPAWTFLET